MKIISDVFDFLADLVWVAFVVLCWLIFWPVLITFYFVDWIIRRAVRAEIERAQEYYMKHRGRSAQKRRHVVMEKTKLSSLIGHQIAEFTECPDEVRLGLVAIVNYRGQTIALLDTSTWTIYDAAGNYFDDDSYDCIQ